MPSQQSPVIYAIGDIHGMFKQLQRLLKQITSDAANFDASRKRLLILLGDYIDRGPQSREVVELVRSEPLKAEGFEQIALKGNHELMMEQFYRDATERSWLRNGGEQTRASYRTGEVSETDRAWMANLKPCHELDSYLFVHAGIRPGLALKDQTETDFVWIRGQFLESTIPHIINGSEKIVVHGHTPEEEPSIRPNRIGIDTGAFFTGCLTGVVLGDGAPRFLQQRGSPASAYRHLKFR